VTPKFFATDWSVSTSTTHELPRQHFVCQDSFALHSLLDPNEEERISVTEEDILNSTPYCATAEADNVELNHQQTEALFLRRPLLTSNELYGERRYKHGIDAPEKKLTRKTSEECTVGMLADRIEKTFSACRKVIHPTNRQMKVRRIMPLHPNRDLWVHPYAQVKYDEPPIITDHTVPPVLVKATKTLTTAFAVYQYNEREETHDIDRSYIWDNQGASMMAADNPFKLVEWPVYNRGDLTQRPVLFSQVSNKIRLKKLTARLPNERQGEHFRSRFMSITWRNPTDEETQREVEARNSMKEPGKI